MKRKHKSGFSLIEVMITTLILAVLAVGSAAVLFRTGGGIQVQGNKRIAMEYGTSRLEALKAEDYRVSKLRAPDIPDVRTLTVNGVSLAITTDLILHGENPGDPDTGILDNEYIEVDVQVQYGRSTDQTINMNATKILL